MNEWSSKKEDLQVYLLDGNSAILQNIPAEHNEKRNISLVDIDDLIKAEQEYIAKSNKLEPKQMPILMLLYSKLPTYPIKITGLKIEEGQIKEATRLHKMLFEIWQRTIKIGFDKLYPYHTFYGDIYGPVSKDLKPLMQDLENKGLVEVKWAKKNGETTIYTLTKTGVTEAEKVWRNTPKEVREIITDTKDFLAFATSKEIIDYFHKKYPQFRKIKEPKNEPN